MKLDKEVIQELITEIGKKGGKISKIYEKHDISQLTSKDMISILKNYLDGLEKYKN